MRAIACQNNFIGKLWIICLISTQLNQNFIMSIERKLCVRVRMHILYNIGSDVNENSMAAGSYMYSMLHLVCVYTIQRSLLS